MSSTLKLNFDGASVSSTFWGWGFILRDHNGDVVFARAKHGRVTSSPLIEEAKSCLHAMKIAFEFGAHRLVVEGDCLSLINMLKSRLIHDTSIGYFVADILTFSAEFDFVSWSFVKKGRNKVVHYLADRQPLCLEGLLWDTDVPEDILSRALDDMYAYVTDNLI